MTVKNNSQNSDNQTSEEQTSSPTVEDLGVQDNAPGEVTATESVQETNEPVVEIVEPPAVSALQAQINEIKISGTQEQKTLILALEKYIDDMAPGKPVPNDTGARNQYYLWKAISRIVENAPVDEFKKLWNILLAIIEEHKDGVFGDRYVFRFSEYWLWSQHELNGLHRILNIIKLTCNANERAKGLKQVSLDRSLTEGFSDEGRQRIITFYKA